MHSPSYIGIAFCMLDDSANREKLPMSSPISKYGETIPADTRIEISERYRRITKSINREFYDSTSETAHTLYVGSYGRHTAIDTSDLDVLAILSSDEYERYDACRGNGQSRLLQSVKEAIISTYPNTNIHADGQVVDVTFSDEMKFEVVPAFEDIDWLGNVTYSYPDTHSGGNWKSTNPKAEQDRMQELNKLSNGLLFDTCQHMRYVRDRHYGSYHLGGIVIDSFVCLAIGAWHWPRPDESLSDNVDCTYEQMLLNEFNWRSHDGLISFSLLAPGSGQSVNLSDDLGTLGKVLRYIA